MPTRRPTPTPAEPAVGWLRGVIVDAIDPERLGAFWQAMLGVPVHERDPGWLELEFGPRGSLMAFQPVDPVAHAPGRIRIDIEIEDLDVATRGSRRSVARSRRSCGSAPARSTG